jgi:hypothetical protein
MPAPLAYPRDGRQSDTALVIARGTRRYLRALGYSTIVEMTLRSGRRADIIAIGADNSVLIVEIKSSVADFRADTKWQDYRLYCDRLFFAVTAEMPREIMPVDAGLLISDAYGAEMVREAPSHPLTSGRRRQVTLQFAQAAAGRLHSLADPGLRDGFT